MQVPLQLIRAISDRVSEGTTPAARALAEELLSRYGESVQAVLFYGSCLRTGDTDGLIDLYVLVDEYRSIPGAQRWSYRLIRPTVFYLELPFEGRVLRSKYAVLTLAEFERGTSRQWFHSYLWARFAQPVGVPYARNDHARERVHHALGQAVLTFHSRVCPMLPPSCDARELWERGLMLSYRAELRAERPATVAGLFDAAPAYYQQLTALAIASLPWASEVLTGAQLARYHIRISTRTRLLCRAAWATRQLQGKLLSILRLGKGLITFRGGLDYILWKIERHSGVTVELTPRLRRHPLLARGVLFWRLYRRGAFR